MKELLKKLGGIDAGMLCIPAQSVEKPGYASGIRRVWVM